VGSAKQSSGSRRASWSYGDRDRRRFECEDAQHEDAKETAKASGMKKSNAEHGHMKITDVKMVSESCK